MEAPIPAEVEVSLEAGQVLSHYRLIEKIGEGGMGVVWKAHDTTLDRDVAIKVLPEKLAGETTRLGRFEREARAVAALNHPNIVTVHSVEEDARGIHFFTMELVGGRPLSHAIRKNGLPLERFLDLAVPLADAVSAAHEQGVTHRDLKPANVMVTREGRVKVLDFGLAKLLRESSTVEPEAPTRSIGLTREGQLMGTVPYMSPEQVEGRSIDHRSDLFSLGVILYEMATGRHPFPGQTQAAVMSAILKDPEIPVTQHRLEVPDDLGRIVHHCLQKDPERRYQTAKDLRNELEELRRCSVSSVTATAPRAAAPSRSKSRVGWITLAVIVAGLAIAGSIFFLERRSKGVPAGGAQRIVVLPFENLGPPEDAYFANGMTEEITSRLAAVRGLVVISRTSARQYADSSKSIPEIGAELGVDYVLEGAVRWSRAGAGTNRIRVTPQLIRVADDGHLWAESYDRVMHDVFDVQLEIAQSVTDHLGVVLAGSDRRLVESQPTDNLEAYHAFLRGRYWATRPHFTAENWEHRMHDFQEAVELDPDFALAHAELARGHALAYYLRHDLSPERLAAADAAAARALELAPGDPRVLLNLGYYRLWGYWDVEGALGYFERARRDRPDDADLLEAKAYVYALQGRWEEAHRTFRRAFDLSPRNAELISEVGRALIVLRRYPEAIAATDQAIRLAPDALWPYLYKIVALWVWYGDPTRSRPVLEELPSTSDEWVRWMWFRQEMFEERYEQALARLESTSDGWLRIKILARPNALLAAYVYEKLGNADRAASAYDEARRLLEAEVVASPTDPRLHSSLGIVYAVQGRREEAIREGSRACELLPRSQDGFYYLPFAIDLAHIYTILGDHDAALERLEYLLDNPSWISAPYLRMDPRWDPLRTDARFQALLEAHAVAP